MKGELIKSAENMLVDTLSDTTNKKTLSIPIAQLATLGAGVSSLLPALRTIITQLTIETQVLANPEMRALLNSLAKTMK